MSIGGKIKGKNVLFVTTKNIDYLRNTQEINLIKKNAEMSEIVGYADKSYIKRLTKIYVTLFFKKIKNYDVIFVGFAPQLVLPFLKIKFRKKYVIEDFFISVYDTMVNDRKKFKTGGAAAKVCHKIDEKTIKSADLIISDTNAHGNYFAREFDTDRRKIETLYLEADKSVYYERKACKPEKLQDKFVVLYFGSILPLQGIDIIMEAAERLKNEKDIYIYIIGPIKDTIKKVKSNNIEYIEWLPQNELAEYISYADLCLAGHFNKAIGKARRTIPGKAYIYEAMEKPMILGDNEANRELHSEGNKKFFVEMGNGEALANKIIEVKSLLGGKNEKDIVDRS